MIRPTLIAALFVLANFGPAPLGLAPLGLGPTALAQGARQQYLQGFESRSRYLTAPYDTSLTGGYFAIAAHYAHGVQIARAWVGISGSNVRSFNSRE